MIDAAIAPAFFRLSLMESIRPLPLLEQLPKVRVWSQALLSRDSVSNSVVAEFSQLYRDNLADGESYLCNCATEA